MGTRHLIAVAKDNGYKVAQYGQWDGYPEVQGLAILKFLKNEFNREKFIRSLDRVSFITDVELKERWSECGAEPDSPFVNMDIADTFNKKYPEHSRNTSAGILTIIQNAAESLKLTDTLNFAADSLFCEWAYVIDFDKNTLEVYSGFNKSPIDSSERFYFLQEENSEYYPVKLFATFDLDHLPTEEEFLATLTQEEKDAIQ